MAERASVPRGRHAPPLEIRRELQRERLFTAAARVFARAGYAEASAEAISREAGMSKATFYEHFDNKEECILALFDESATVVINAMREAADAAGDDPATRLRAGIRAFLGAVAEHPDESQTLLVEIIGAGPRAAERRDGVLGRFAHQLEVENERAAAGGAVPRFASPVDAFAVVGAVVELASRQVRHGIPEDVRALEPVVERLVLGLLAQAAVSQPPAA
jgi:AcrR family transcriptional regulator